MDEDAAPATSKSAYQVREREKPTLHHKIKRKQQADQDVEWHQE
jgi:hypothetical protein